MIWKTTLALLAALFFNKKKSAQPLPFFKTLTILLIFSGSFFNLSNVYSGDCPQNNVNVQSVEFRKADGTPFLPTDDYPIGTQVDGKIYATFGGSTTNAYSLAVRYNIYVNDQFDRRRFC
jgi:hypothetical protein